ncbi:MAG TPA: aromatic amino acid transport family protein [Candidatus Paceibacterota bacterium]|nr:aromatic amino acid transport family protein [Candidatus Magasanikbacteria bacterium]HPW34180.1 aromatic amino acid transport family protein [Candidatus Paceibacterota bacterium]
MMKIFREFILPTSFLSGTIIGAGIFSLPYFFIKAGVGLGFAALGVWTLVFIIIHLMYGDLVLRHGDGHRFAGYARIYFGRLGYWISIIMTVVEMFFVLTIYLLLSSSFVSLLMPSSSVIAQVIVFWGVGTLIIFSGTKRVALFEFIAIAGILAAIVLIAWFGLPGFFQKTFEFASSQPVSWLVVFGPLIFALNGRPAIPSVMHYFKRIGKEEKKSKSSIIWGTVVSAFVYAVFVVGVLGATKTVTPDSVSGLIGIFPTWTILSVFGVLGILSLLSSYFSIGLDVKHSLQLDINFPNYIASILVVLIPILIYLINPGSFISLIEIAGGFFIGLEGIMILMMWRKAKKIAPTVFVKKINPIFYWGMMAAFVLSMGYVLAENFLFI